MQSSRTWGPEASQRATAWSSGRPLTRARLAPRVVISLGRTTNGTWKEERPLRSRSFPHWVSRTHGREAVSPPIVGEGDRILRDPRSRAEPAGSLRKARSLRARPADSLQEARNRAQEGRSRAEPAFRTSEASQEQTSRGGELDCSRHRSRADFRPPESGQAAGSRASESEGPAGGELLRTGRPEVDRERDLTAVRSIARERAD